AEAAKVVLRQFHQEGNGQKASSIKPTLRVRATVATADPEPGPRRDVKPYSTVAVSVTRLTWSADQINVIPRSFIGPAPSGSLPGLPAPERSISSVPPAGQATVRANRGRRVGARRRAAGPRLLHTCGLAGSGTAARRWSVAGIPCRAAGAPGLRWWDRSGPV